MLDFEVDSLYFDEPLKAETQECIDQASKEYGKPEAEKRLNRAYFLEPEHPTVLVALYRFFYYQQRYEDAIVVAERVLNQFSVKLGLNGNWQNIDAEALLKNKKMMTDVRFYLLALKGAGYLDLKLGHLDRAIKRLKKVIECDSENRFNAASLLEIAEDEISRQNGIYRLKV